MSKIDYYSTIDEMCRYLFGSLVSFYTCNQENVLFSHFATMLRLQNSKKTNFILLIINSKEHEHNETLTCVFSVSISLSTCTDLFGFHLLLTRLSVLWQKSIVGHRIQALYVRNWQRCPVSRSR